MSLIKKISTYSIRPLLELEGFVNDQTVIITRASIDGSDIFFINDIIFNCYLKLGGNSFTPQFD